MQNSKPTDSLACAGFGKLPARKPSTYPPVYRPQAGAATQQSVTGTAQTKSLLPPPVYRPQQSNKTMQPAVARRMTFTKPSPLPASRGAVQAEFVGAKPFLAACDRARIVPNPAAQSSAAQQKPNPNRPMIQVKLAPGVESFPVNLQPKSGGWLLPEEVQAKMEAALGADFSDVRIHVGPEVGGIGAIAFTWGSNIHFAPGYYNPHTLEGQRLLAHELAHVVQQRAGRVRNPYGNGVAVVQDHALEAEADRVGKAITFRPKKPSCGCAQPHQCACGKGSIQRLEMTTPFATLQAQRVLQPALKKKGKDPFLSGNPNRDEKGEGKIEYESRGKGTGHVMGECFLKSSECEGKRVTTSHHNCCLGGWKSGGKSFQPNDAPDQCMRC